MAYGTGGGLLVSVCYLWYSDICIAKMEEGEGGHKRTTVLHVDGNPPPTPSDIQTFFHYFHVLS